MYSLSGRLNSISFNTLIALTILSSLNFLTSYYNKVDPTDIKFKVNDFDTFTMDRYINEEASSFTFDLEANLTKVFNWNTNMLFVYLSCEFNTSKSDFNHVILWDQRISRDDVENHVIKVKKEYVEYYLTDVNKQLKD